MRVRLLYSTSSSFVFDPCKTTGFNGGETEDYTVFVSSGIPLRIKANLEGTYDSVLDENRDQLRVLGKLPATEPFTALGFTKVNNPNQEQLIDSAKVLSVTGDDAIVDPAKPAIPEGVQCER